VEDKDLTQKTSREGEEEGTNKNKFTHETERVSEVSKDNGGEKLEPNKDSKGGKKRR